jgi:hypothetical protein
MLYNEGSLHNNIRKKQNRHYCINICFYFSVDATSHENNMDLYWNYIQLKNWD